MNEDRFWAKVERKTSSGCWDWVGARTAPGWHGVILWDGRRQVAHRVSWQIHVGPIPAGLNVCHACDNPGCVRPDHLWLGTQRANMIDASRKRRLHMQTHPQTFCKRGHELVEPNILWQHGRRRCKRCANDLRNESRHLLPGDQEDAMARLDAVLGGVG